VTAPTPEIVDEAFACLVGPSTTELDGLSSAPRQATPAASGNQGVDGSVPSPVAGPSTPPERQPRERAVVSLCRRKQVWTFDRQCGCVICFALSRPLGDERNPK
jgi:hypothetical protein